MPRNRYTRREGQDLNGVAVRWGRPCFQDGEDWPDLDRLRGHIEAGRVQGLGEIATQFVGLGPSDPALEPYFALAEEYDLPVFIHMLPGIFPVAYEGDWPSVHMRNHRGALGNPLLLEEALLKHPGVRVAVVHSGWPMVDEMISILYQHPQVYAEVGVLQVTSLLRASRVLRPASATGARGLRGQRNGRWEVVANHVTRVQRR